MSSGRTTTVDIDIGGTFTDCFVRHGDAIATGKAETTDHELSVGFLNAVDDAVASLPVDRSELLRSTTMLRYSTTVALNKLLQRDGTTLGLLTTTGLEDTIYVGRGSQWADGLPVHERRNVVDAEKPAPLIPPGMAVGVSERVDHEGNVVQPLDEAEVREKVQWLVDEGARGFVVCLAWSFQNPVHEHRVRELVRDEYPDAYLGSAPVYLSSEISPQRGEYERTMTTILNAYLHRPIVDELFGVGDQLRAEGYEDPLMMIHNTGGMAEVFRTSAINMFNAGPVAALIGSSYLGEAYGFDNVIAADMGGTSFDLSLVVQGSTRSYDMDPVIDRWRVNAAMLEAKSIGAGGGSIASVNEDLDDRLEVGPASAGSNPGPACYHQGGREPTVTDADVVLGYLNPEHFHGGDKPLSERHARRALQREVAGPLDVSVEEAAALVRKLVDAKMGNTIYKETALRGFDPREFVMFGFGGAGPTHAADVARHAGIDTIVTFTYSSVFSAFGSSVMDSTHLHERSHHLALLDPGSLEYLTDFAAFNDVVAELADRARRDFEGEGFDAEDVTFTLELDMKYGSQLDVTRVLSPHLTVDSVDDVEAVCEAFEAEYEDTYSPISTSPESGIVVENVLLTGVVAREKPSLPTHDLAGEDPSEARRDEREVFWTTEEGFVATPIYAQEALQPGNVVDGPAVIEAPNTTTAVTPDMTFRLDEHLSGTLTRDGGGA